MTNRLIQDPHIYKKGKWIKLPKLNEGPDRFHREYLFSGTSTNVATAVKACNNLNQIVARNYLILKKLLSYLGINRDNTEKFSKPNKSVFNHFWEKLSHTSRRGELINLGKKLDSINERLGKIEEKLERVKPHEIPINRDEVLNFTNQLKAISEILKDIKGE